MTRARISLVTLAQQAIAEVLGAGDHAVDATAGNGQDTLFLARTVGATGRVTAFDIQPAALAATRRRLQAHDRLAAVDLIAAGHETMADHITGPVRAVMFNLGYLPGSDKTVTTRTDTSLQGLAAACRLLTPGGRISVMAYTGHPGGDAEHDAVLTLLGGLDDNWRWHRANPPGMPASAPHLFVLDLKPKEDHHPCIGKP